MDIPNFSVWVDADSCPVPVRDYVIRFAKRLLFKTFFVANREIGMPKQDNFKMIVAENHKDAADDLIVEKVEQNDIVITRDIPLANRLVEKNITVLNDRGVLYTKENIRERLSIRNFNFELNQMSITTDKGGSYGKKEAQLFVNCFDKEIQKKLKNQ
ncbi:MAG: DUF188 domain-containing protein [Treponemataceae bacterium]|nr:DUF188 domain-containing protein [Treponemataceae bacterium]